MSNRIHELLRQGEYAPQAVLDAARQNALQEHAQTLAYMERDLADGVAEAVFQDTEIFRGGFPELTDRLAGLLDDTDFLTDLNERLSALGEAYAEDKDLMRMHFYKPDKVAALFQQFAKPYLNYSARDADKPRQPVNYAGRVAERTVDNVRKPSVLAQLHAKRAERTAEPQKSQKRKSHNMEL